LLPATSQDSPRGGRWVRTSEHAATLPAFDTPQPLDGYFRDVAATLSPGSVPDPAVAGEIMTRHDTHRVT